MDEERKKEVRKALVQYKKDLSEFTEDQRVVWFAAYAYTVGTMLGPHGFDKVSETYKLMCEATKHA